MLEGDAAERATPPFHLWPEHVPAIELWGAVQTQWRHGFNGPTGLDYAGVRIVIAQRPKWRRRGRRLFGELQIMERATLEEWARRRDAG